MLIETIFEPSRGLRKIDKDGAVRTRERSLLTCYDVLLTAAWHRSTVSVSPSSC